MDVSYQIIVEKAADQNNHLPALRLGQTLLLLDLAK